MLDSDAREKVTSERIIESCLAKFRRMPTSKGLMRRLNAVRLTAILMIVPSEFRFDCSIYHSELQTGVPLDFEMSMFWRMQPGRKTKFHFGDVGLRHICGIFPDSSSQLLSCPRSFAGLLQRALRASADTALKRMERCRKVFVGIYGAEFLEMTTLHEDYTWKVIKVEKANGLAQRGCGCTVKLDGQTLLASFSLRSEARPQSRR